MWWAVGHTPQIREVIWGASSARRPTRKASKPRSSGTWKYARLTSPFSSRKIEIFPWPSSRVIGLMTTFCAISSPPLAAPELRRRERVAVEDARGVRDLREDAPRLRLVVHVHDRREVQKRTAAVVRRRVERTEASRARHRAVDAQGLAPASGDGPEADHALREVAHLRVELYLRDALHVGEQELLRLRRVQLALVAQGLRTRQHGAFWRQLPGENRADRLGEELRRRRAPGQVVVDVDDLVERLGGVPELGQLEFPFRDLDLRGRDGPAALGHGGAVAIVEVEDRLAVPEVRESRNAAKMGTAPEGDDEPRLATEELRHLLLLGHPDGAVDEAYRD